MKKLLLLAIMLPLVGCTASIGTNPPATTTTYSTPVVRSTTYTAPAATSTTVTRTHY